MDWSWTINHGHTQENDKVQVEEYSHAIWYPKVLIVDNGTQFEGNPFKEWSEEKKIHRWCTSVAYHEANGQTEVSNKIILNGLKKHFMNSKAAWVEKLPTTLWLYRTTSRSSTRETPFSLTYDIEAILPLEIISIYFQVTEFDANTNEVEQHQDLDVPDEKPEATDLYQEAYKART